MHGLKTMTSDFSVSEAVSRMAAQIEREGWHIFVRIDHAKEARNKGLAMRPTELILFENPAIGTLLMQDRQISAIDLPMKILAWEDEAGKVNITYNDPEWLKERHGVTDNEAIKKIAQVVAGVCRAGSQKQ